MKSRPIEVNGEQFPSARAAARYIVAEEAKIGNTRKENTVAKELQRCFPENGGHSWEMYGKWLVTAVMIAVEPEGRCGTD
jgi:hypothetical protein